MRIVSIMIVLISMSATVTYSNNKTALAPIKFGMETHVSVYKIILCSKMVDAINVLL